MPHCLYQMKYLRNEDDSKNRKSIYLRKHEIEMTHCFRWGSEIGNVFARKKEESSR
jgi:hypothetical protein